MANRVPANGKQGTRSKGKQGTRSKGKQGTRSKGKQGTRSTNRVPGVLDAVQYQEYS